MTNLAPQPIFQGFGPNGTALAGGSLYTYAAGTTTPQATYTDYAGGTPNTNPVILNSFGQASVWLDTALSYKFVLKDNLGNQVWTQDNIQTPPPGGSSFIPNADNTYDIGSASFRWRNGYFGTQVYIAGLPVLNNGIIGYSPQTGAETAGTITPTDYGYQGLEVIDVLRYGIIPNDTTKRAANTTALQGLLDPTKTGPTGVVIFPNTTGADTYYFGGVIACRRGIYMDLMGSTLDNTYTAAAGDVNTGFLYTRGDFSVQNGTINIAVNTSAASGSGQAIYLGARGTDNTYFGVGGTFDSLLTVKMGNVKLRNLRIAINNSGTNIASCYGVVLLGGMTNVLCENVWIEGNTTLPGGVYCEFGWATSPAGTATTQTSHPNNLVFRNMRITNLSSTAPTSDYAGIALVSCYNVLLEGIYINTAYNGIEWRIGEDYFYVPWSGVDEIGVKRNFTVRNVVMQNLGGTGLSLNGASAITNASYMYATINALSTPAKYVAQTDLMSFEVDGFAIQAAGAGIIVSGPCTIRNGIANGAASSGQLIITDECTRFSVDNVQLLGSSSYGVRANFGGAIWSPARLKSGSITNSRICGNTTDGIVIGNSENIVIQNCQIGYNSTMDGVTETTQTNGIYAAVSSGAYGVVCDGNLVTPASGGTAYVLVGTGPAGCDIRHPRGTYTTSGTWNINAVSPSTSTNLGAAANAINTTDKYYGKQCLNTSTNKLFIAQGSNATDTWISVDGATTITPV